MGGLCDMNGSVQRGVTNGDGSHCLVQLALPGYMGYASKSQSLP